MTENELSYRIIGAVIELHKTIGPGLLESAYEAALAYELVVMGYEVKRQLAMPFIYKGVKQEVGYRIDLLAPVHFAQILTYLKLSDIKLGLLINFNSKLVKDSIHRVVNNL